MVAAQESTARGRIAAAAAEHGWREMFDDVAENVRIYERSGHMIIVGYRPAGAVTGATRMYGSPSRRPREDMPTDELTHLDSGKAEQVLGWLAAPAAVRGELRTLTRADNRCGHQPKSLTKLPSLVDLERRTF